MSDERSDHWIVAKILLEDTTDREAAAYAEIIKGRDIETGALDRALGLVGEIISTEEAPRCWIRVLGDGEDHPCRLYAGHLGDHE